MPPQNPTKKKKKGRPPAHQNTFAFRHNPKSKKTEKILNSPNVGVCRRCFEKIEWRKRYRKYKPRTQPGKCNICSQKNVMAAYHTICTKCTASDAAFSAMEKYMGSIRDDEDKVADADGDEQNSDADADESANENGNKVEIKESNETTPQPPAKNPRRRKVCAMCTHSPALSKYDSLPPEASELISQIQELEDALEDGLDATDGHKLTLREVRGVERRIEKLKLEIGKKKGGGSEDEEDGEDGGEEEGSDDGEESEGDAPDSEEEEEEDDPFLKAVGGKDKLLVGEDYQKMLLAKEPQKIG